LRSVRRAYIAAPFVSGETAKNRECYLFSDRCCRYRGWISAVFTLSPEASPRTPAWRGTSTTVSRALRLISSGALDDQSIPQLCHRLGVTDGHLGRFFHQHLGTSPGAIAQTRRLQFAKKLIDQSSLSMTEVVMAAGYGSVRCFNDHVRNIWKNASGAA